MVYRASAYINIFLKPTKNKGNECWRLLRSSSLILHSKVKIADIKFTDLIIIFHLSLSLSSSPFSAGWTHHLYGWIYIQNDQVHAILSIIISSKYYNYLSMIKREYVCSLVWPDCLLLTWYVRLFCLCLWLIDAIRIVVHCAFTCAHLELCMTANTYLSFSYCDREWFTLVFMPYDRYYEYEMEIIMSVLRECGAVSVPTVHVSFQRHIEMFADYNDAKVCLNARFFR